MVTKLLNAEETSSYREEGFFLPINILNETQVEHYRDKLESFETKSGKAIQGSHRSNSHLLFTWIDELVRHPAILDAVEDKKCTQN
mgnify:CR=1 FL=1